MPICEFADTVVVPFPFTDLPISKRRPAVVLSSRAFNDASSQSILGMITTATRSLWTGDIPISDLVAAGIQHPSVIRFKLFTLPNTLIARHLGHLGPADVAELKASLVEIIGP